MLTRGELRHPRLSTTDLAGHIVLEVRPVGKHILIRFDSGRTLHSHLGMDGAWQVYPAGGRWRRPAHQARAVLSTASSSAVGFNLHELYLVRTSDEFQLTGHLGPDVLAPDWDARQHAEAVTRLTGDEHRAVGAALLDQSVVAGVGNVYQTEVCFLLGCSPWTPVADVDADRAIRLCRDLMIGNVWRRRRNTTGYAHGGAQHWVYGRRTCLRCNTTVRHGRHGGDLGANSRDRLATYCPHCQPGPVP